MLTETGAALPPQETPDSAARLAREALHLFAATPRSRDMPWDPGPMVLADHARLEADQLETTSAAWLERIPAPVPTTTNICGSGNRTKSQASLHSRRLL